MNARALLLVTVVAAFGAAACAENDASMQVYAVCTPPMPDAEGACTYPEKCATTIGGGVDADLALTGGTVYMPIQLNNRRAANADATTGHLDTATAWVDGFELSYEGLAAAGGTVSVTSKPLPPGGSGVTVVPLIPAGAISSTTLSAWPSTETRSGKVFVRAKGHWADGGEWETSDNFQIPVRLCNGCTGAAPTCSDGSEQLACPQTGQTATYAACTSTTTP